MQNNSVRDDLKSGLGLSIIAHIAVVAAFIVQVKVFQKPYIDLSSAIRVDMVGLPDKIDDRKMPDKITAPLPKPIPEPTPEEPKTIEKPSTKLPEKIKPAPKPEPNTINLKKTKSKQKEALEKLKKLSAIEKIKNELTKEEIAKKQIEAQEAAKQAVAKGRMVMPGSALRGLEKLEAQDYLQKLDLQIKQAWSLPQWLVNQPLKAQVLVKFNGKGELLSKEILKSSGNSTYDSYCLQAIEQASPFPEVPEKFWEKFRVDGVVVGFPE